MPNPKGPRYVSIEVLNDPVVKKVNVDEDLPQVLGLPIADALGELQRMTGSVPEAAVVPTDQHDVVGQGSSGFARPIMNLTDTLENVLHTLGSEEVTFRISTQSRQGLEGFSC